MEEIILQQRTPEWADLRRGLFTASEIHKLAGKKQDTETALTYIKSKSAESICDQFPPSVTSKEMQHGIDFEPYARELYGQLFNEQILTHGFKFWPLNELAGCSPDGLIAGRNKGIEIKCPYSPEKHFENLLMFSGQDLKSEKPEYYWQIQFSMICFEYDVWDYVSYSPFFKPEYQLISIEIKRNTEDCKFIIERVLWAIEKKNEFLQKIKL
jgi:hypothetical protein